MVIQIFKNTKDLIGRTNMLDTKTVCQQSSINKWWDTSQDIRCLCLHFSSVFLSLHRQPLCQPVTRFNQSINKGSKWSSSRILNANVCYYIDNKGNDYNLKYPGYT